MRGVFIFGSYRLILPGFYVSWSKFNVNNNLIYPNKSECTFVQLILFIQKLK